MIDRKREELAALAHEMWSGWMKYMFGKCNGPTSAGSLLIPKESVVRWQRQMNTTYADLPESEKESDRKEADRIIDLLFFSEG